jgi:DNA-binding NtrC family response regulator
MNMEVNDFPPVGLVVEDDHSLRELAAAALEETGLRIIEAASAEEALYLLRDHTGAVTFAFVNARLPCLMSGIDLARKLSERWPTITLLLTCSEPNALEGELPPRTSVIPKPWLVLDILREAERARAQDNVSREPMVRMH